MPHHPLVRHLRDALERGGEGPASRIIVEEVWLRVVEGSLATGARLPTIREVGIALGVSPRSVQRAYDELERLGVAESRLGEGTFVALAPPPEEERERIRSFNALCAETVTRATELGFSLNELLDALADYRESLSPGTESEP